MITGNILVIFNSDQSHHTIESFIDDALKEATEQFLFPVEDDGNIHHKHLEREISEAFSQGKAKILPGIRDILKKFLFKTEEQQHDWHLKPQSSIRKILETDYEAGLTSQEAFDRLKQYGANILPESEPRSALKIFVDQINSLPVYLLGAAAGVSIITGGILDAVIIAGVVAVNAVIGYYTESAAEKTIHSLQSFVRPAAEVIRDGRMVRVAAEKLVPGDILSLKPGASVSADCRILYEHRLTIDESLLTGESLPASKNNTILEDENIPVADRKNMAYMGTLVTGGQATAVVVATGQNTEIGQLQMLLEDISTPETPISKQLGKLGDQLVLMCVGVSGIVFVMGFLRGNGFLQMLRMAISLAAAAVPEGLPAAATINFAMGIKKMRTHGVLVRHLQALETLGAAQTVCLDKTGTITLNRMTVLKLHSGATCIRVKNNSFYVGNSKIHPEATEEFKQLFQICVLCNESEINGTDENEAVMLSGSPTENALLRVALNAGIDVAGLRKIYPLVNLNHRSEERLFMSSYHKSQNSESIYAVKGSPPEVLAMCKWQMVGGERVLLTEESIQEIETENEKMAGESLRVLGFAWNHAKNGESVDLETDLVWTGLVGMSDPIREGVNELIQVFHGAGIDTVMITGDQHSTAQAVAQQLGINRQEPLEILDSSQLTVLEPELLKAIAQKVHVYSRVSPAHKLKIVQALQSANKVVAMTGDGINDGPALKAADIGIAMGKSGTDVAREVADVVLEEDRLEILVMAVRDGRNIYSNIRKSVHFFLSTNLSEIMLMFSAMGLGIGSPLNVMQLLWINIISDIFPGLALSMEEPETDILERPPRPADAALFSNLDFNRMAFESGVITAGALGAYGFGIARYGLGARAGGLAFQTLTLGQLLHAYSCRSQSRNLFGGKKMRSNPYLNMALGGSLALQAMTIVFPPLRRLLGISPPGVLDLLVIGATSVVPLFINEWTKNKEL
jgi:Ca2+-transporting ATPase